MNEHEANETCLFRFNAMEERMDRIEDRDDKRGETLHIIEKAIVEIQVANKTTASILSKFENKLDYLSVRPKSSDDKWFKLFEKILMILVGIIATLWV